MRQRFAGILLSAILLSLGAAAQTTQVKMVEGADSVQLDESKDLQVQLVPLDSIITIALKNSPAIKFQQDIVDAAVYQVHFMQQAWTNDISAFGNYAIGNQNLVTLDNQTPNGVGSTNLSNGYRTGIQITLPLYELVGRKARINVYKSQMQSSVDKREAVKQEITQFLIQEYYSMLYYRSMIGIRSDAKQAGINQYQVAQQEFKDGIIQASELSRIKAIEVNARADYEEAKRQFSTHYFIFQNAVGVPIQQLMLKK